MLTLPRKGGETKIVGSSNGGVLNIAAKAGRSQIIAVTGGTWILLGKGMDACHDLKPSEKDDVEAEGTSDTLGVTTVVNGTESNAESWNEVAIVTILL